MGAGSRSSSKTRLRVAITQWLVWLSNAFAKSLYLGSAVNTKSGGQSRMSRKVRCSITTEVACSASKVKALSDQVERD